MLENEDDSYKNISTFFLAYMSEEDFEELGEPNCQYLVRYSGDDDRYSGNDEKDSAGQSMKNIICTAIQRRKKTSGS